MNPHFHNDAHTKQATAPSAGIDRRAALKLFVSGTALALASCGRPAEQVVPYVEMPERVTPGVPLRFASALPLAGYGRGVIVTSVEGRPIKIDGNPRHPASLGATDVFAEATVLGSSVDRCLEASLALRSGPLKAPYSTPEFNRGARSRRRCCRASSGYDRARARAGAADRAHDVADFASANRRADENSSASQMVSLRAG